MSLGGGLPRIPKAPRVPRAPRAPRAPRIRSPRSVATAAVSRNPLVRAWRRIRSNRLVKRAGGATGASGAARAERGADAPLVATSTAVAPSPATSLSAASPLTSDPDALDGATDAAASAPRERGPAAHHRPGPGATRAQRRRARRAARRAAPRVRRMGRRERRRLEGALWRSVLEVGRAQWAEDFDTGGLDPRFVSHFDARRRVVVTVPRAEGDRSVVGPGGLVVEDVDARRVLVGHLAIVGFDPDGQRFVGADPSEGRIAQRPVFVLHCATLSDPLEVTDAMRLEGVEQPNGRFRMLAGSRVSVGTARGS